MVVTTVSSKSDENTVIPELLISRNVHNQRKYWIVIKLNLFRDRAYSPLFSPPKTTSIQWGQAPYENLVATATFAIAFSNTDYICIATGILEDDSQAFVRGILRAHKTVIGCLFRASETGGPAAEYVVIGR